MAEDCRLPDFESKPDRSTCFHMCPCNAISNLDNFQIVNYFSMQLMEVFAPSGVYDNKAVTMQ